MTSDSNSNSSYVKLQATEKADYRFEDVLQFWFPTQPSGKQAMIVRRWDWWFRGGADAAVIERFSPLLEQAA